MVMDPNVDSLLWNGRGRDSQGSDKIYGVVPAIVIKINDSKEKRHMQAAVQLRFPWLMDEVSGDIQPWARCITFASGKNGDGAPCGWVSTPQIGDEVLVGFENGDIHTPYVLGQLWHPKGKIEPNPVQPLPPVKFPKVNTDDDDVDKDDPKDPDPVEDEKVKPDLDDLKFWYVSQQPDIANLTFYYGTLPPSKFPTLQNLTLSFEL